MLTIVPHMYVIGEISKIPQSMHKTLHPLLMPHDITAALDVHLAAGVVETGLHE
jgi:hypothetical protein